MGNFEKLGILVIIVLVVTILVLTFWGMNIPLAEEGPLARELSGRTETGTIPADDPKGSQEEPADAPVKTKVWPDDDKPPVDPNPIDPVNNGGEKDRPVEVEPVEPKTVRHVVKKDESLYGIAALYLGKGTLWPRIQAANPGIDPGNLKIGQALLIPGAEKAAVVKDEPDRPVPANARTCAVKKGDSLSAIARRELGKESLWREIYALNRDLIGPDPGAVVPGMTLVLPR